MQIPVVISGPAAAVTASDARLVGVFNDDDEDAYVNALLAAAQSQIDGSDGWLGRAIGVQTLEMTLPAWHVVDTGCLPLPPYVDTVSNTLSLDGRMRAFRWRAGYGTEPAKPLPAAIKHAIIMMAGVLRDATPEEEGALRRVSVDGIATHDYAVPDGAADAMQSAAERLLAPFKVWRL